MKYETIHLVCFSPTHSSHAIAEAVAKGIRIKHVEETDLTYEEPGNPVCIKNGLAVVAVPVYAGRVADTALKRLEKVKGENTPAILIVLYGNRDYEDALIELRDWAQESGFIPLAGGAFIGEHSYSRSDKPIAAGRPDKLDQQIAVDFGYEIANKLDETLKLSGLPPLLVKGNIPYKEKRPQTPAAPITVEELCIQCGHCAEICPVQAIRILDEVMSDKNLCIKCCACVKQCPNDARVFNTPYTDMLFANCSVRKEPELFL